MSVTRQDIEACARLLGHTETWSGTPVVNVEPGIVRAFDPLNIAIDQLALARAAKLMVDYELGEVATPLDMRIDYCGDKRFWYWPSDGTEAECIIKAASAVQIEREKQQ